MDRLCGSNNDSCDRRLLFDVVWSRSTNVTVNGGRRVPFACTDSTQWEKSLLLLLLLLLHQG